MTILEQILAGLQQKFAGVDTAILTRIATKKAEGVTDETKVNSIIEGISFSDVLNSYGDFRAGDASKTAVTNYEKRHNLKDGKPKLPHAQTLSECHLQEQIYLSYFSQLQKSYRSHKQPQPNLQEEWL